MKSKPSPLRKPSYRKRTNQAYSVTGKIKRCTHISDDKIDRVRIAADFDVQGSGPNLGIGAKSESLSVDVEFQRLQSCKLRRSDGKQAGCCV